MSQTFQVLRCYKCFIFQIHQRKKSTKFECKLCGEKQSIKRHYAIGTGKDCRIHVQKLNQMQAEKYPVPDNSDMSEISDDLKSSDSDPDVSQDIPPAKISKWSNYIEKQNKCDLEEENSAESVESSIQGKNYILPSNKYIMKKQTKKQQKASDKAYQKQDMSENTSPKWVNQIKSNEESSENSIHIGHNSKVNLFKTRVSY